MSAEPMERLARRHRARPTGAILEALHAEGWSVFTDVRWPGSRRGSVDHVVVGPPGVFVIDVKDWAGRIEVRDNSFWCRGRRQHRVVGQASEAAHAVAGLVSGPAASTVRSAICFERDEALVGWCYEVMICSTANVREMLTRRPPMLSAEEVTLASIELDLGFRAAADPPPRTPRLQMPGQRRPRRLREPKVRRSEPRISRSFRRGVLKVSVLGLVGILAISQVPKVIEYGGHLKDRAVDAVRPETVLPQIGFDSCSALRRVYPDGVGTVAAVRKVKGPWGVPAIQPEVYRASQPLDKDGDGLVCERADR